MAGTFDLDNTKIGQTIDTACVLASMKLTSPPSGPLQAFSYDPATTLPNNGGNFCLCTTVGGRLTQFYLYDAWSNTMPKGIVVPITPQPPPAKQLADLVLTACPPGFSMQIVTV
jgi:hypothetical protein